MTSMGQQYGTLVILVRYNSPTPETKQSYKTDYYDIFKAMEDTQHISMDLLLATGTGTVVWRLSTSRQACFEMIVDKAKTVIC